MAGKMFAVMRLMRRGRIGQGDEPIDVEGVPARPVAGMPDSDHPVQPIGFIPVFDNVDAAVDWSDGGLYTLVTIGDDDAERARHAPGASEHA